MPLLDATGETGHRGVGTELDAGGGGGDENGLALTEGHDVLLAVILMVNKAAASGDAHHDHKRVQFREILGARLVQVEERGGEVLAADQFGLGVLDAGIFSPVVRVDIVVDGYPVAMGSYLLSNGKQMKVMAVNHPSVGYSWDYWYRVIQHFLRNS